MDLLFIIIRALGIAVECVGLSVILYAVLRAIIEMIHRRYTLDHIRRHLGKILLMGLEIVIAGDIILAAVVRDLSGILQLTGIVFIRALLEHAVQKEVEFKD